MRAQWTNKAGYYATALQVLFMLLVLNQQHCCWAWYVRTPGQTKDWTDLSKLIVETFEKPRLDASMIEKARWNLVEKKLAEQAVYRQYVGAARKLKGSKYGIFVAKQVGVGVIGVAEIGVQQVLSEKDDVPIRRPTIGILCVDEDFGRQGVGAALVKRCQELVADVWQDDTLYAEVEESNAKAIAFFTSLGFRVVGDETVMVDIRTRGQVEQRPHLVLSREVAVTAASVSD